MSAKGLGKGFEVLIPIDMDVSDVANGNRDKVHRLSIDTIVPKNDQPRQEFNEASLQELAQSIVEHGIIQPLIVAQNEQNLYSIIAGERRWRAAKLAGLKNVPAIIRSVSDHEQLEIALLENVQRADLTPIELASSLLRLHTQFSQSYEDIAKRLGKALTTVINNIRLLNLPEVMQSSLQNGTITEGHARALLSLQKKPESQNDLYNLILEKKWNVRQAEQYVVSVKKGQLVKRGDDQPARSLVDETTSQIKDKLQAQKVYVQRSNKGSGKLVITYKTEAEFARIVDQILNR